MLMKTRRALITAGLGALVLSSLAISPEEAYACTPGVTGTGPTVTVSPDYSNPTRTAVGYDTSDFSVSVNTCL